MYIFTDAVKCSLKETTNRIVFKTTPTLTDYSLDNLF